MMKERPSALVSKAMTDFDDAKDQAKLSETKEPIEKTIDKLLPSHILFYRDGVSESQYGMVLHEEKPQIVDACKEYFEEVRKTSMAKNRGGLNLRSTWTPKITLIVVTKRHHARFYPTTGNQVNLNVGSVADTRVVTPNHLSFYLQSHASALGTARSALYNVIYDNVGYSANDLQAIVSNDRTF